MEVVFVINLDCSLLYQFFEGMKVNVGSLVSDLWGQLSDLLFHVLLILIFIFVEVHEDWSSWGSERKLDGVGEGEVDSDEMAEVDVVEVWLG